MAGPLHKAFQVQGHHVLFTATAVDGGQPRRLAARRGGGGAVVARWVAARWVGCGGWARVAGCLDKTLQVQGDQVLFTATAVGGGQPRRSAARRPRRPPRRGDPRRGDSRRGWWGVVGGLAWRGAWTRHLRCRGTRSCSQARRLAADSHGGWRRGDSRRGGGGAVGGARWVGSRGGVVGQGIAGAGGPGPVHRHGGWRRGDPRRPAATRGAVGGGAVGGLAWRGAWTRHFRCRGTMSCA
jgi:hypothetical protein